MSTFTSRPCKLGKNINGRTEMRGDEPVGACDIPIRGFMLEKDEVDELVGEQYWNSIFDSGNGKRADQPAFPNVKAHQLADKYEGSATIVMGPNQTDIDIEKCSLASFLLEPLPGGLVQLSVTIQANHAVEKFIHKLFARLDTEVNLTLSIGDKVEQAKSKQAQLPLNTFGDGESSKTGSDGDADHSRTHVDAFKRGKKTGRGPKGVH